MATRASRLFHGKLTTDGMKYSDELAERVIARFGLNPITQKVWRTRGSIPDRYFSETYVPRQSILDDKIKLQKERDLLNILHRPEFRSKSVAALAEISYYILQDALQDDKVIQC